MAMHRGTPTHSLWSGLRQILTHGVITALAVAIAFSLPGIANYILNEWWPEVESNANLLLATEIALASVLALLFNLAKIAWDSKQGVLTARLASLMYARNAGAGWWSRRRERALVRQLPAARDAFVLTLTGYDTFVADDSLLRGVIEKAYEIRVMLVNPVGKALQERADSLPREITVLTLHTEIEATIGYLSGLRKFGKKVKLKFYDEEPFWKLIVLGDYVWVQHCHSGFAVKQQPEFVFALQHREPRHGLFIPFYMVFLNQWNDARHPEYDFSTNELVYRDASGKETGRAVLGVPINGATVPLPSSRAHGRTLDRDRGPDRGVRVVSLEVEILVAEIEDVPYRRVEPHARQRPRRARELLSRLLQMVEVEVRIAEGMHEFARLQPTYLRNHQREQRIGSDVERHAEENVGAALVHLARKPSFRHVELKQDVTRGQLHLVDLGGVPGRHDVAA